MIGELNFMLFTLEDLSENSFLIGQIDEYKSPIKINELGFGETHFSSSSCSGQNSYNHL